MTAMPAVYEAMCQAVRFLETTLTTHYDQWMNILIFGPLPLGTDFRETGVAMHI